MWIPGNDKDVAPHQKYRWRFKSCQWPSMHWDRMADPCREWRAQYAYWGVKISGWSVNCDVELWVEDPEVTEMKRVTEITLSNKTPITDHHNVCKYTAGERKGVISLAAISGYTYTTEQLRALAQTLEAFANAIDKDADKSE